MSITYSNSVIVPYLLKFPVRLFACSPVRLFACSPVRLFACSPVRLFACSPVRLFACSPVRLFACSPVRLFACSPVRLFACSPVRLFACSYVFGSPVITIASCLVDAIRAGRNHTISEYLRLFWHRYKEETTKQDATLCSTRLATRGLL